MPYSIGDDGYAIVELVTHENLNERFRQFLADLISKSSCDSVVGDTNYVKLAWLASKTIAEKEEALIAFNNALEVFD